MRRPAAALAAAVVAAGAADPSAAPPEPRMTAVQRATVAKAHAQSGALSAAARPDVVAFMDSAAFKAELAQYSQDLAALSGEDLLRRFDAEIPLSELVHNVGHDGNTLDVMTNAPYFLNDWQLGALGLKNSSSKLGASAEEGIMGFPPFAVTGRPTYAEASDRIYYVALNAFKIDGGNPNFGSISVVMRWSYVANATIVSAVDTGLFVRCPGYTPVYTPPPAPVGAGPCACSRDYPYCWSDGKGFDNYCYKSEFSNDKSPSVCPGTCTANAAGYTPPPAPPPHHHGGTRGNCSAWDPPTVGTLDDGAYYHLILPNVRYWNSTFRSGGSAERNLARWLARMLLHYDTAPPLTSDEISPGYYWEADPAVNLQWSGVKFLIGAGPQLIGTAEGARLRDWCVKQGWPLLWGSTVGGHGHANLTAANQRLVDPVVATALGLDLTRDAGFGAAADAVAAAWQQAAPSAAAWGALWGAAGGASSALSVEPLYAAAGCDPECTGVRTKDGACVCAP